MRRFAFITLVLAVLAAGLFFSTRSTASPAPAPQDTVVAVASAHREDLAQTLTVSAELVPYQEVEVMAKVAGYVRTINVDVGDRVQSGQLIATLEVPEMQDDLARASAALARSRAELDRANDDLRRAQSAAHLAHVNSSRLEGVNAQRPGLVAQAELDEALSRDQIAAAQESAARANLAAAQQLIRVSEAEQRKLQTLSAYTRVTAPFAGVITRRFADTGAMIQAGTASHSQAMPLVRLSQASQLRLALPIPESACGSVHPGTPLAIRIPALHRSLDAKITRLAGKLDTSTRTMIAEVDLPNPDGALLPGLFAEATLTLQSSPAALTVPLAALRREQGEAFVYVVSASGHIARRPVSTGLEAPNRIQITSGLAVGDQVVTSAQDRLRAGLRVRAIPSPAPAKENS